MLSGQVQSLLCQFLGNQSYYPMNSKEFEDEISRQMTGSVYDARGYMSHASYLATEKGRAVSVRFDDPL